MATGAISPRLAICLAIAVACMAAETFLTHSAYGLDAATVLEKSADQVRIDNFRVGLRVNTVKSRRKPYEYFLWLMGQHDESSTSIFVDFEEPKHTRGLRFLLRFHENTPEKPPEGYMFLPATGAYLRLKPGKESDEIGGTGLKMVDFRGFVPKKGDEEELLGEELEGGALCYLVAVRSKEGRVTEKYWISKDDFSVRKSLSYGPGETPVREFRVLEFFEAESGKRHPRRQAIIDKVNDSRIELTYETGLYNVTLPEEIFHPAKFGTTQWRTVRQ